MSSGIVESRHYSSSALVHLMQTHGRSRCQLLKPEETVDQIALDRVGLVPPCQTVFKQVYSGSKVFLRSQRVYLEVTVSGTMTYQTLLAHIGPGLSNRNECTNGASVEGL